MPYRPIIAMPEQIKRLDPSFKTCTDLEFFGYDPPRTLEPGKNMIADSTTELPMISVVLPKPGLVPPPIAKETAVALAPEKDPSKPNYKSSIQPDGHEHYGAKPSGHIEEDPGTSNSRGPVGVELTSQLSTTPTNAEHTADALQIGRDQEKPGSQKEITSDSKSDPAGEKSESDPSSNEQSSESQQYHPDSDSNGHNPEHKQLQDNGDNNTNELVEQHISDTHSPNQNDLRSEQGDHKDIKHKPFLDPSTIPQLSKQPSSNLPSIVEPNQRTRDPGASLNDQSYNPATISPQQMSAMENESIPNQPSYQTRVTNAKASPAEPSQSIRVLPTTDAEPSVNEVNSTAVSTKGDSRSSEPLSDEAISSALGGANETFLSASVDQRARFSARAFSREETNATGSSIEPFDNHARVSLSMPGPITVLGALFGAVLIVL